MFFAITTSMGTSPHTTGSFRYTYCYQISQILYESRTDYPQSGTDVVYVGY